MHRFTTIPEMIAQTVDRFGDRGLVALEQKTRAGTAQITHAGLMQRVELFACGLAALGAGKGDRLGILSENRPEWVIADYAVLSLGAVDVPIFPTLTAEQVRYIFGNAETSLVIVSNDFQAKKLLAVASALPALRTIVIMAPTAQTPVDARVIAFADVMTMGSAFAAKHPRYIAELLPSITPDDLATIIYTSGTTGEPKGVMLTHGNLVSNIKSSLAAMPRIDENDVVLSYLPLCHSFERLASYFMFASGVRCVLAESIDKVAEDLRAVRPTIVTTVPRLLERMYGRIAKRIAAGPDRARRIFEWAVDTGRKYHAARRAGGADLVLLARRRAAKYLVYDKLQELIGGRLRFFVAGGAALSKDLGEFFEAIGIVVLEGYGMTECSPVISVNRFDAYVFGTVGPPIPGIEVRIAEDGEILTRGPHVMRGYWRDEAATREAIDAGGWLHTGDIGEFDAAGNIKITDRKKNLFVSSGGKNIAPQAIENELLQSIYIDQVFLIGDKRQYVAALIVPEFDALRSFAVEHGCTAIDNASLVEDPQVLGLFQYEVDRRQINLANYERVRRFALLAEPFTIESGELTPTMKIRRPVVEQKFASLIETLYVR